MGSKDYQRDNFTVFCDKSSSAWLDTCSTIVHNKFRRRYTCKAVVTNLARAPLLGSWTGGGGRILHRCCRAVYVELSRHSFHYKCLCVFRTKQFRLYSKYGQMCVETLDSRMKNGELFQGLFAWFRVGNQIGLGCIESTQTKQQSVWTCFAAHNTDLLHLYFQKHNIATEMLKFRWKARCDTGGACSAVLTARLSNRATTNTVGKISRERRGRDGTCLEFVSACFWAEETGERNNKYGGYVSKEYGTVLPARGWLFVFTCRCF